MACEKCKKTKLSSCEDCDFTVNTDCVDYTGDRLCVEDSTVKNGSARTLTSVIEKLDTLCECKDRSAKIIDDNYTLIPEDVCKILLLSGDIAEDPENITYTITLPTGQDAVPFIDKILIFKDISLQQTPSGSVLWEFSEEIKYDWENDLSTDSYETLSYSLHKVLWLTFIKHPDGNYKWTPISTNDTSFDIEERVDQLEIDVSGLTVIVNNLEALGPPEYIEVEDGDMSNNWINAGAGTWRIYKQGYEVKFIGYIGDGNVGQLVYTLPVGYRPSTPAIFPGVTNTCFGDSGQSCQINIATNGQITISVCGYLTGDPLTGGTSIPISHINYFIT